MACRIHVRIPRQSFNLKLLAAAGIKGGQLGELAYPQLSLHVEVYFVQEAIRRSLLPIEGILYQRILTVTGVDSGEQKLP